jgi:hypothetical protein
MRTSTVDFAIDAYEGSRPTLPDVSFGTFVDGEAAELARLSERGVTLFASRKPRLKASQVFPFLAAFVAFTFASPLQFTDPLQELRHSGSSLLWRSRRRRGRQVSLEEAWRRVALVYQEAQERRARQREADAGEFAWHFMGEEL